MMPQRALNNYDIPRYILGTPIFSERQDRRAAVFPRQRSHFRFIPICRRKVLAAMNAPSTSKARLNWRLGLAYAEAAPIEVSLLDCHPFSAGLHSPSDSQVDGKRPITCRRRLPAAKLGTVCSADERGQKAGAQTGAQFARWSCI